jgi:hypothetical protein
MSRSGFIGPIAGPVSFGILARARTRSMRTFLIALAAAAGTTVMLAAATIPLDGTRSAPAPGAWILGRIAGFALATIVIVTVVHAPLMALLGRVVRSGRDQPPRAALGLAGALATFGVFMLVPVLETRSLAPLAWTMDGWLRRPVEFATDWFPFLAGGAVFTVTGWRRPRGDGGTSADHDRTR